MVVVMLSRYQRMSGRATAQSRFRGLACLLSQATSRIHWRIGFAGVPPGLAGTDIAEQTGRGSKADFLADNDMVGDAHTAAQHGTVTNPDRAGNTPNAATITERPRTTLRRSDKDYRSWSVHR